MGQIGSRDFSEISITNHRPFQQDLVESQAERAASEERGRRAIVEAAKLADELR